MKMLGFLRSINLISTQSVRFVIREKKTNASKRVMNWPNIQKA